MKKNLWLPLLFVSLLAVSCKPEPTPPAPAPADPGITLAMHLDAFFKGSALNWNQEYITDPGDTLRFDKLKFLLSGFSLQKEDGSWVALPDAYAYLNLKEGRDSVVLKNVPAGNYKGFRFQMGIDSAINHSDPSQWGLEHPLNPALTEMHWGWGGGYIFNVIEGYFRDGGKVSGFSFHIALEKNARTHVFERNFSISAATRIRMALHADKYFSHFLPFSLKNDGAMSHSGFIDPVMEKFILNTPGIFECKSIDAL